MPMLELSRTDGTVLYLMFNTIEAVYTVDDKDGVDGKCRVIVTPSGTLYRVKETFEQINDKVKQVAIQLQAGAQTARVSADFMRKIQAGL